MRLLKHSRFIISAFLIVAISVILCACDKNNNNNVTMKYSNANAYTVADRGEVSANVAELEIDWVNGSISIVSSDTAQTVSFYEVAEGETPTADTTMHYLLDVNTLRIKYAKSGTSKLGNLRKNLYITVPSYTQLWKIDVESVSSSVNIDCDANKIDIEQVSGDIDVKGKAQRVDIESVSGNVFVSCDTVLAELDVETVSGNVCLKLNENTGFRLEFDTVSGFMSNVFSSQMVNQGRSYVYLGGGCLIEVDTVSGSLLLEKRVQ